MASVASSQNGDTKRRNRGRKKKNSDTNDNDNANIVRNVDDFGVKSKNSPLNTNTQNSSGSQRGTNKRRNRRKPKHPPQTAEVSDGENKDDDNLETTNAPIQGDNNNRKGQTDRKNVHQNKGKGKNSDAKTTAANTNSNSTRAESGNRNSDDNEQNPSKKKKRGRGKRYPWRRHIPAGTVDPITLDPLVSLPYPPLALMASAPYVPVPVWPLEDNGNKQPQRQTDPEEERKERERKLLQEQWGGKVLNSTGESISAVCESDGDYSKPPPSEGRKNFYNLFDGRALAYYMVSQLQFIDPLNRRDLTRDELVNLDRYLRRHHFDDINVVEAYDTKGVSLSTAGAASTTAAGRMEILQQEARVLLNTLFGGGALPPAAASSSSSLRLHRNNRYHDNALNMQYSAYQAAQRQQQHRQHLELHGLQAASAPFGEDAGIYGDSSGGVLVIDDDLNPSLRGQNLQRASAPPLLWSTSRITSEHGHAAALQAHNFPALSTTVAVPAQDSSLRSTAPEFRPLGDNTPARAADPAPASAHTNKKPLPPSSSLKLIGKAVKKTNPEEQQRQWEAREAARKRAMLSNLTFGTNPASWDYVPGASATGSDPSSLVASEGSEPTQAQLDRNRAFAEALGVVPSTVRGGPGNFQAAGWARPTTVPSEDMDEFGAELHSALYTDSLIVQAREHMGALLKLEKKLKTFLEDDKAASLPLNKMDRPLRKLVHEYAVFWRLKSESFDAEPKRYVQVFKASDTSAPYPLLSDAARNWSGPAGAGAMLEHTSLQAAGQSTRGLIPDLSTLPIRPKSSTVAALSPAKAVRDPLPQNSRFASLGDTKERRKLELQPRTFPLELPPFEPPKDETEGADELLRRRLERLEHQKLKQLEKNERKQRALEAAFASDSEDEEVGVAEDDSGSDWGGVEEVFRVSDDDE